VTEPGNNVHLDVIEPFPDESSDICCAGSSLPVAWFPIAKQAGLEHASMEDFSLLRTNDSTKDLGEIETASPTTDSEPPPLDRPLLQAGLPSADGPQAPVQPASTQHFLDKVNQFPQYQRNQHN